MKLKLITVTSDMHEPGFLKLSADADKHGWDFVAIPCRWQGFGTKLLKVYEYLKENTDVTHIVFVDAFDVRVLGNPQELISKITDPSKMLISAERGCWPRPDWCDYYVYQPDNGFAYVNSGAYFTPREVLLELLEADMPGYGDDDQLWMTKQYLFANDGRMVLDYGQRVFNSHSFIREGEYQYFNGRVVIGGSVPVIAHSNGRTVDPELDNL